MNPSFQERLRIQRQMESKATEALLPRDWGFRCIAKCCHEAAL